MWKLAWRGLRYYWPLHLSGGMSLAVAALVVSGSLMVGHSVEQSLQHLALRRIGPTDCAVVSSRRLAEDSANLIRQGGEGLSTAGLLVVPCTVARLGADGRETRRVGNVTLVGFDEGFLRYIAGARPGMGSERSNSAAQLTLQAGQVAINRYVWQELGEPDPGETLVLHTQRLSEIPREFVLGRRDRVLAPGAPVSLSRVVRSTEFPAEFTLRPGPRPPRVVFAPLALVQQVTAAENRINTVLVRAAAPCDAGRLLNGWQRRLRPGHLGLRIRVDDLGYVAVETDRMILHPAVVEAAEAVAKAAGIDSAVTAIQVAISIRPAHDPGHEIPYSIVAALDVSLPPPLGGLQLVNGKTAPQLKPDQILLNTWAAEDLGVNAGDEVELAYYETDLAGRLHERTATFTVAGVVRMEGIAADPDLVPEYKGVTDARTISQWDAPFPIDVRRIRPKDEQYWARYRTVPKAFVAPEVAARLWTSRWGTWTSIRFASGRLTPDQVRDVLARELVSHLDLGRLGISVVPVRDRALQAARGSTDFRGLFIGFSFFLVAAALILAAAMYRLFLVQRVSQIGLLTALGLSRGQLFWLLALETAPVVVVCSLFGALAGAGFAKLMIVGLTTRWRGALRLNELYFYFSPTALLVALVVAVALAVPVYYFSVRAFLKKPVRTLLAGRAEEAAPRRVSRLVVTLSLVSAGAALLSVAVAIWFGWAVVGFFVAGVLVLGAGLGGLRAFVAAPRRSADVPRRWLGLAWLGIRHVKRTPTRSLLVGLLVSCATFMVISVGANRHEPENLSSDKHTGHGGFAVLATTVVPLYADLNDPADRRNLAISRPDDPFWNQLRIYRLRYRPGDDASCLNAYRPQQPALVGVPAEFRKRDGFRFARTIRPVENPWELLAGDTDGGAVPAIGDNQTLTWILHHGVGDDMPVRSTTGETVRLHFVAALQRSIFQSELLVSEEQFVEHFPDVEGYRLFLVECDPALAERTEAFLEEELGPYGCDATITVHRLAEYLQVENTYLDTFLILGGLGVVLGTFGLGAVLWRSVLERAGELALLRAVGFRPASLAFMLLLEDMGLVLAGVLSGTVAAIVAILPHLVRAAEEIPIRDVVLLIGTVALVGIASGALALIPLLRLPLVETLRRDA